MKQKPLRPSRDSYYLPWLIIVAADAFVISFSLLLAYFLRFHTIIYEAYPPPPPPYIPDVTAYLLLALLTATIGIFIFERLGLYHNRVGLDRSVHPFTLIIAIIVSYTVVLAGLFYVRQFTFSRMTIAIALPITIFGMVASRVLLKRLQLLFIHKGIVFRKTLLIGPADRCFDLIEKLHAHHGSQYQVLGFVASDANDRSGKSWLPCLGKTDGIESVIAIHQVDHIIVAMPPEEHQTIMRIMGLCKQKNVSFQVIPELYDHISRKISIEEIDGLPSILFGETPLDGMGQVIKRAMDIIVSAMALAVASPILIAVAFWIKLDSKGSILYVQERIGANGKKFKIYKFRSMKTDAEVRSGPVWATANDPRTTSLGRFLRRYNLDELPQFFNVLQGDMSLVGPRPERPFFVDQFKEELPLYMRRHMVKTGITGWAQVHGLRGDTSVQERLEYDLYYVKNWSILLDIKIMLKTLTSFKNAY